MYGAGIGISYNDLVDNKKSASQSVIEGRIGNQSNRNKYDADHYAKHGSVR